MRSNEMSQFWMILNSAIAKTPLAINYLVISVDTLLKIY